MNGIMYYPRVPLPTPASATPLGDTKGIHQSLLKTILGYSWLLMDIKLRLMGMNSYWKPLEAIDGYENTSQVLGALPWHQKCWRIGWPKS